MMYLSRLLLLMLGVSVLGCTEQQQLENDVQDVQEAREDVAEAREDATEEVQEEQQDLREEQQDLTQGAHPTTAPERCCPPGNDVWARVALFDHGKCDASATRL